MTDAERASQLADEIDDELNELRERFADRENDHFSFGLKFSSWDVISRALRLLAHERDVIERCAKIAEDFRFPSATDWLRRDVAADIADTMEGRK